MTVGDELSERELRVLAATIKTYIETAEPAGSKTIAERSGLGISAASIRTTMGELEAKGYLFHRHTSAGRIPTDRGYRVYVNSRDPIVYRVLNLHNTLFKRLRFVCKVFLAIKGLSDKRRSRR